MCEQFVDDDDFLPENEWKKLTPAKHWSIIPNRCMKCKERTGTNKITELKKEIAALKKVQMQSFAAVTVTALDVFTEGLEATRKGANFSLSFGGREEANHLKARK